MSAELLRITDLSVTIGTGVDAVAALSGVDLEVAGGEVVGLVGESGGGKSMTARAVIGLLPGAARATGTVSVAGHDVLSMSARELRKHRGAGAAMCFQNPRSALSPVRTVGRQLVDRLDAHQQLRGRRARTAALALLDQVGIRDARRRFDSYPHEISGGMCQRVMIALALACAPALLLADEPTTGLDVTLTREILALFRRAADEENRGVLLISHDLASASQVCDRIVVLYAGTVVEHGPTAQVLGSPAHPYTRALIESVPDLDGGTVQATRGTMPMLRQPPTSCPFVPRCAAARDDCRAERPPLLDQQPGWQAACFHPHGAPAPAPLPVVALPNQGSEDAAATDGPAPAPALEVDGVDLTYAGRFGRSAHRALQDVSLTVARGESVGIVGESGSGKTTLARVITGLLPATAGTVRIDGADLSAMSRTERQQLHRRVQMVFQDPQGSLSPRRTVLQAVTEPLQLLDHNREQARQRATEALARTGLGESVLDRRPAQLSGGQAQRVGIARALIVDPELVVLDEPTSALDVTVQAQVLELIKDLAAERTRSFVFISHDLATVRGFCDRVVVLYLGKVVEEGPVGQVFGAPLHPYTRALLGAAPRLTRASPPASVRLARDLDQSSAGTGCPLIPRCPFAVPACAEPQPLQEFAPGQRAACHRALDPDVRGSVDETVPAASSAPVSGRS